MWYVFRIECGFNEDKNEFLDATKHGSLRGKFCSVLVGFGALFVLSILVNPINMVFAEETSIQSELETIQNSIDALGEKSYHPKYLGNDLFQIKQIGKTIDAKISQDNDPKTQATLFNLSDKYNRVALFFLDEISSEQENNNVSIVSKQLVGKTKLFVINMDISTNKKLETIVTKDFVKNEVNRLEAEKKFQIVFSEIAIKNDKLGGMKDSLMDTIIQVAATEEYDLLDVGLQKLVKKTEHYKDKQIKESIDKTMKVVYELQSKNFKDGKYGQALVDDTDSKKELKLALKTMVDENVKDVILFVDEAKKKSQSDYDSSVQKNSDKSNNGKSNGKSNGKGNGKNK